MNGNQAIWLNSWKAVLDPIGGGEESKNPRMNRHQIFRRTKGCLQAIYRKNAA